MEARKYIYAHYQQRELDLTQVADAIGCNPSYLSRIMKQELGISFKDFLTMLRISQAISLMRNDRLSLNQIAEQVGYSNQHYFSAAFKNCQGFSPSEILENSDPGRSEVVKKWILALLLFVCLCTGGCGTESVRTDDYEYLIGVSLTNVMEPWLNNLAEVIGSRAETEKNVN